MTRNEVLEWLDADIQAAKFRMELVEIGLLRAAAELIRAAGWRPIAEAPSSKSLLVGGWEGDYWDTDMIPKHTALDCGYTHYLPEPEPPAREVPNERG